ncbi:MAG: MBL fold metallo-hydrolase, partial [Alphaproteobacteria bacterium]|nr:MBL fold metallo-hydrolase [Alphaproteobacteria bacterium]
MKAVVIPVTPFQQNCTVIWCEETMAGAVVDPGGDLDQIQKAIEEQGVKVEKILVTHGH